MASRITRQGGQQAFNKWLQQPRKKQKKSPSCRMEMQRRAPVMLAVTLDSSLTIYLSTLMTTNAGC